MAMPTFGLPELSNTVTNLAKAAELQSLQLAISSAKDTITSVKANKITVADLASIKKLQQVMSEA